MHSISGRHHIYQKVGTVGVYPPKRMMSHPSVFAGALLILFLMPEISSLKLLSKSSCDSQLIKTKKACTVSWIQLQMTDQPFDKDYIPPREHDTTIYTIRSPGSAPPEGYLSSDINSLGEGKQLRVLIYIGLALLPCLLLVPFFLSREFIPPSDSFSLLP
jgi:hypothetical protein